MVDIHSRDRIVENYIKWLYSLVGENTREYGCFWRVIRRLFDKEYYWIVHNDANRSEDGLLLRRVFAEEFGYDLDELKEAIDKPCTVLEMLIAFAHRIDQDIMWNPDMGDRTAFWFWKMLANAGMDPNRYNDGYFNGETMMELNKMIDRVLTRQYSRNGEGGFFPLKDEKKDQRKVELWYQMQFWIGENFPI